MSKAHRFDPSILREYDVRGIVGDTLTADDANVLGQVFSIMVREKGGSRVAVGYDGRPSSIQLEAALVEGLTAGGMEVLRIGLGPTPMLYFAVHELAADGGIMITGSHNPPDFNGFKLVLGKDSLYGDSIQRFGTIAAEENLQAGATLHAGAEGTTHEISGKAHLKATAKLNAAVEDAYVERLLADRDSGDLKTVWKNMGKLKVAWDNGNGSGGNVMRRLCDPDTGLPGRHIMLNETIDGSFPAHHPDPTVPENLVQLQKAVLDEGCDIGIAFDGDGDRIGVVDDQGSILWGDQLMVLLARDVLREIPEATIIADVKASAVLFDLIREDKGKPVMGRTGHSLIKSEIFRLNAPLAGEMSGHIFFNDRYYGYDDALYAAVRTLEALSRQGRPLSEIRAEWPKVVNTPELRFDCPEDRKFAAIEEVKERLRGTGAEVNDIDGVRVKNADGWWLLRASNTQAVLVARCEASDVAGLERLKAALVEQLRASGIEPPDF